MLRKGHLGITLLLASVVLVFDGVTLLQGVFITAVMFVSTRMPDWDLFLARAPLLGRFISHRGVSHTVPAAFLVGAVAAGFTYAAERAGLFALDTPVVLGQPTSWTLPVFVGVTLAYLGHIVGDCLTVGNKPLRPFYPFWKADLRLKLFRADSYIANNTLLFAGGLAYSLAYLLALGSTFGTF